MLTNTRIYGPNLYTKTNSSNWFQNISQSKIICEISSLNVDPNNEKRVIKKKI